MEGIILQKGFAFPFFSMHLKKVAITALFDMFLLVTCTKRCIIMH